MSEIFRFKRFEIDQTGCAMKINTDGVLLGAMASADNPANMLDIGTGTGVIALMLAQRFPDTRITAIEIDPGTAQTACKNFNASVFANRISCFGVALEAFEPTTPYDLIVSNPPYFLQSLANPDERKRTARHTDIVFFDGMLARASAWLTPTGSLQLVLPPAVAGQVAQRAATEYGLLIQWEIAVYSFTDDDSPVRKILALGREGETGIRSDFVIYEHRGRHSEAYRQLLRDFFIIF
ncbi:tRNA1(Val) (adenine(37)-N6)-methyltransferase [Parapedobacter lycopersici]|uniref:tRNA1(Val) (adenine(37)-N6)-methyltransferase n=1 Tax=Parapedobacter lycopersici TaxID=1864939 RepID=UPI00214D1382|nr:methyltransferase [Parapedobacter lycopersici]